MFSDSQYVIKAFNEHWIDGWIQKGWKTAGNKPVKNVELCNIILIFAAETGKNNGKETKILGRKTYR